MIKQAIGYNKDGPTYQNFSNIFSLQGQGSTSIGLSQSIKQNHVRAKGTTMTDTNKDKNDQMLSQFKSKILQQMQHKLRNTTNDLTIKPGQLELCDYQMTSSPDQNLHGQRRRNSAEFRGKTTSSITGGRSSKFMTKPNSCERLDDKDNDY